MEERLKQIIALKTGGNQTRFCELFGWKPSYLAKLLKGINFGLRPVCSILAKFPDIDARWLLFGEGSMLIDKTCSDLRSELYSSVVSLLDFEKYIPVMSPSEQHRFAVCVRKGKTPDFTDEEIESLHGRLVKKEVETEARFIAAMEKSKTGKSKTGKSKINTVL